MKSLLAGMEESERILKRGNQLRRRGFYPLLEKVCADHHALEVEVLSDDRDKYAIDARHALWCAMYDAIGSASAVGKIWGCDHTSVLNALRKRGSR